jgi:hypothetical protein
MDPNPAAGSHLMVFGWRQLRSSEAAPTHTNFQRAILPISTVGSIVIDSANEQHTIKIAKRVKALYNWDRGL